MATVGFSQKLQLRYSKGHCSKQLDALCIPKTPVKLHLLLELYNLPSKCSVQQLNQSQPLVDSVTKNATSHHLLLDHFILSDEAAAANMYNEPVHMS